MYSEEAEEILERMLNRVSDDKDKREGSIIHDALAPASIELEAIRADLDNAEYENDIDTASREGVIAKCAMRGITPTPATNAVLSVTFTPSGLTVTPGTRFNSEVGTYHLDFNGDLVCEQAGTVGNQYTGIVLPIDNVEGLETAVINSILVYGKNEQSTESLREEYHNSFDSKAFGGNVPQYKEEVMKIAGVGGVKVAPVWNGAGTVKLVIVDTEFAPATERLVTNVQNVFDPTGTGHGDGLAPIGHVVTVVSAGSTTIDVSFTLTLDTGYTYDDVKDNVRSVIATYIKNVASGWDDSQTLIVRLAQVEATVLTVEGVLDISNVTLNGTAGNVTLDEFKVPVLGSVTNV